MPPCTHCEYTRCPKCGHDCAISSSQGIVDNSIALDPVKYPLDYNGAFAKLKKYVNMGIVLETPIHRYDEPRISKRIELQMNADLRGTGYKIDPVIRNGEMTLVEE